MASVRAAAAAAAPLGSGAAAPDPQREFAFSTGDFEFLAALAYQRAGISLSDSKRNLVYGRLSRRLRALGLTSFGEYRQYIEGGDGSEIERFINSISTNHTKFFREAHHFTHLSSSVAEIFAQQDQKRAVRRLRVWSAGCSTGEEPYTIALVLRREIADMTRHDIKILATDIDTDVLAKASRGEYSADALDNIPDPFCRYFKPTEAGNGATIKIAQEVRSLITFRPLNLVEAWPMKGPFDAIFCRNVMIYFDAQTKSNLIDRFIRLIKPTGFLYIGHSESLLGSHPGLRLMGRTIYRRDA
jgi:chemotaxis protein methyltransferase CheR